jgi:hypothetical protein
MGTLSETEIDDETLELVLTTGDRVKLHLGYDRVRVLDSNGDEVGCIEFGSSEYGDDEDDAETVWRVTHMFIEGGGGKYKRQGIGTRAVKFFLWANAGDGFEITENDGLRRDDGSHLTGDGVPFMAHLGRLHKAGKLME